MTDTGDIQERISRRAHEIWEREGHPHGRHDEHWAQAEAEIRAEDSAGKPAGTARAAAKGTRAAAEDLSAVAAGTEPPKSASKPAARKAAAPKSAVQPEKPAKAPAAKPARVRKDGGKNASTG